jgi:large subunit ribosomal protein L17
MRHGVKGNHLGRKVGHRRALLANLAIALFTHKRISTTVAKAKALRVYAEPLITKAVKAAKTESAASATHQHRVVFSFLQNKEAVKELFGPIATKVGDRPGGYLRIIKTGFRKGDGAETALIELVDFNEVYGKKSDSDSAEAGAKRTRRGGKKIAVSGTAPAAAIVATATPIIEDVVEVVAPLEHVTETVVETTTEVVTGLDQELAEAGFSESNMTEVEGGDIYIDPTPDTTENTDDKA